MTISGIRAHWQRLQQSAVFFGVFATGVRIELWVAGRQLWWLDLSRWFLACR